tara:strand:- start:4966 stop:6510 length:1545 start_codon:yes stop_codon:yes gene_type:complete
MKHLKIWKYLSAPWIGFSIFFFTSFLALAFLQNISESFLTSALISKLLINTISLTILVGFFTFIIAAPFAIITSLYKFPGHKFFSWSLTLPLAFPAYIYAFIFVGGLEYSGPLATWFREFEIILPSVRNMLGASVIMSLALYPYIFLLMKAQIRYLGIPIFKAAKTLGKSDVTVIRTILLPALKPAIIAGMILAMLETLADFGGVSILRIETFTVAIYNAWFGYQDYFSGARLAGILFIFVILLLILSKKLTDSNKIGSISRDSFDKIPLNKSLGIICFSACSLLFLIAFGLPFVQLLVWSDLSETFFSVPNIKLFMNSGFLGFFTASLISITALVLSLAYAGSTKMRGIFTAATIGYALPGSVIAVGLLIVINEILGVSITSMGIFGLVLCLSIRFMTPAFQYLISSLENIPESSKKALSTLPVNSIKAFTSLYLPSMRPAILVAFLVVFIEVVKEQPATLILRPVGFETLSSKIYNFTSEGQWELAANPSLLLVMLSFILVYFLNKRLDRNE